MNILKQIVKSTVAVFMSLSVFFPTAFEIEHFNSEHEHTVCNNHTATHYHALDLDCKLIKLKPSREYFFQATQWVPENPPVITITPFNCYEFVSQYQCSHCSLRGPPSFS